MLQRTRQALVADPVPASSVTLHPPTTGPILAPSPLHVVMALPAALRAQVQNITRKTRVRGWALAPASAMQLAALLVQLKPRQVLEFGSGTSTLALAAAARYLHQQGHNCHILSLDQEWKFADRTRQRLAESALVDYASVIHCPLQAQRALGETVHSYGVTASTLRAYLHAAVDFAFIDGPASAPFLGQPGSRLATLPLCISVAAPVMHFVLDDSKRRKEQHILHRWLNLPGVSLLQESPLGRGMSLGRYTRLEEILAD